MTHSWSSSILPSWLLGPSNIGNVLPRGWGTHKLKQCWQIWYQQEGCAYTVCIPWSFFKWCAVNIIYLDLRFQQSGTELMFTTGINTLPGWLVHKQTARSTGVNGVKSIPRMHRLHRIQRRTGAHMIACFFFFKKYVHECVLDHSSDVHCVGGWLDSTQRKWFTSCVNGKQKQFSIGEFRKVKQAIYILAPFWISEHGLEIQIRQLGCKKCAKWGKKKKKKRDGKLLMLN